MCVRRALVVGAMLAAGPALADEPLSAIDWLSRSVREPAVAAPGAGPEVTPALPEEVATTPLGELRLDAVGIVPPRVSGLPADLWGATPVDELVRLVAEARADAPPAALELLKMLLVAEADPPADANGDGRLLMARLDKLLTLGALDEAQALIEIAGPTQPELFRRWFDISLLTGLEDRACAAMRAAPGIAPTIHARIFCLARGGDWSAAALTLETGRALGFLSPAEDELLARFLEPELADGAEPLPPPEHVTPLVYRLYEAIGEPLPTSHLPLAFAHLDLRQIAGWKARIEAAERLARTGAIPAGRLIEIYTERQPPASGGIWDRVAAVQKFDLALLSGDPEAVARFLPDAWANMRRAGLEVPFARAYGERLARIALPEAVRRVALRVVLLSASYDRGTAAATPTTPREALWLGVARGDTTGIAAETALGREIARVFAHPHAPSRLEAMARDGRLGEAILRALALVSAARPPDPADAAEGLALLRAVGLEDHARRLALELLILDAEAP
ncbi:MAG: hypothetical protein D6688_06195 [Alphaproteobacteria bacterium]|nr:MAG: hypothetical protein D6688_06195 [Alphaproteobacteria bacterium]